MSTKGARFLHLACQGGGSPPCPPSVTPLDKSVCVWARGIKVQSNPFWSHAPAHATIVALSILAHNICLS